MTPTEQDKELLKSLTIEIFTKCEKPLEYVTKLVIADAEDGELRGMSVREYNPDMIKTRYSQQIANSLMPFIQKRIAADRKRVVLEARLYDNERTLAHIQNDMPIERLKTVVENRIAELKAQQEEV